MKIGRLGALVPYYPPALLERSRLSDYAPSYVTNYLNPNFVIGCIEKRGSKKAQYQRDEYMSQLLEFAGVDIPELLKMYKRTPIVPESVYKDFGKYHAQVDLSGVDWEALETGAQWLVSHKKRALGGYRPQYLNYDAVKSLLDLTKSATALWNSVFPDKRSLMDNPDFKISMTKFFYGYFRGEPIYMLFLALQKEEIRPSEKIDDMKIRSIIVGAIYQLICGHMFYADMDDHIAANWKKYRGGIGMSFFNGQYHEKIVEYERTKAKGFSDIGKYDSRQNYYLQQLCAYVANSVYDQTYVSFYDLLGELLPVARELGFEDFQVNVPYVRNRLVEDSVVGPTIMPDGLLVMTDTGEKSGSHRTGHGNTDRYKIVEFASASQEFKTYKQYIESDIRVDQTGDDQIYGGENYDHFDRMNNIWKSMGCEIEFHKVSSVEELEYLGSRPVLVDWGGTVRWMPLVNSSKVLAGLADKLGDRDLNSDIGRLSSARVLCHFTEDAPVIDVMIEQFKKDFPSCRSDVRWWNSEQINGFYFGALESSDLTDLTLLNRSLQDSKFSSFFIAAHSCSAHFEGKVDQCREKSEISFRVTGKYCGPGWSDNKHQLSVRNGKEKPVDKLDNACREHDTAYATPGADLAEADFVLARKALTSDNPWKFLVAAGIGGQGILRKLKFLHRYNDETPIQETNQQIKQELRRMVNKVVVNENGKGGKGGRRSRRNRKRNGRSKRRVVFKARRGRGNAPMAAIPAAFVPSIPRIKNARVKISKDGKSYRMSGFEPIGTVTVNNGDGVGKVLFRKNLTPLNMEGTRLQIIGTLFEKWKINRITYHWTPQQGTGQGGEVVMAVDPDPSDVLVDLPIQYNRACEQGGKVIVAYDRRESVSFKPEKKANDYFTSDNADIRLSQAGIFYVVSNSVWTTSVTLGTITMSYDITFYKPTMEGAGSPITNTAVAHFISADSNHVFGSTAPETQEGSMWSFGWIGPQTLTMPAAIGGVYVIRAWWQSEVSFNISAVPTFSFVGADVYKGPEATWDYFPQAIYQGLFANFCTVLKATATTIKIIATGNLTGFTNPEDQFCGVFAAKTNANVAITRPLKTIENLQKNFEEKLKLLEAKYEKRLRLLEEESDSSSDSDDVPIDEMILKKIARSQSKYASLNGNKGEAEQK